MAEPKRAKRERARRAPPRPAPQAASLDNTRDQQPELTGVGLDGTGIVARHAALLGDPRLGPPGGAQRVRVVQRLQETCGNFYVTQLLQRVVALDAPHAGKKLDPRHDPKFLAVKNRIGQHAKQQKEHAPAKSKAAEAQAAAQGPPNDIASQAAATQVDKMAQQKPGEFDKQAFIAAVKQAIDAAAPKNLEEADDFKKSDKAGQVKGQVSGMVGKGKQDSEHAIKQSNTEPPDASNAKPKTVKPMGEEKAGAAPDDGGAAQAIPSPKPAAETSLVAGPAQVNQQMAEADVTEDQLKQSNEPQFNDALGAKKNAEKESVAAPAQYRAVETQALAKAGGDAKSKAGADLHSMHGERSSALSAVTGQKTGAKGQDEAKRAEVASKIESIFNQTRTEVSGILDGLDGKVTSAFDAGEHAARQQFESSVDQRMQAYKDKRYGGALGWTNWLHDKFMGMPDEVNAFYRDGRNQYLKQMEGVISRVADIVGGELGRARARIAQGRQQVKDYVAKQPKELQKVAQNAEQQISGKFDQLGSDVDNKQSALVQTLADKYVAARDALDDRINQMKAENKGLIDAVKDAIGGVIKTILQLKDMLLNVLQKAANVIGDIIKDPIKFLGNLVGAIKQGLNQFVSNIGTHLKKGLMGWLFGTLGDAGIQLPDSFDLKGILMLVLQILGLTYDNVRGIAIKIAGEKVVSAIEGTAKFFVTLANEGPAGLWQWVKDKIADLNIKDVVIGAIKDFVITRIIMAGVTWLIGLLNPAGAFIKACKMIYDVIMFFIERGSQIMEFVNSILDGMGAIVAGSLGAAANLVETSLAKILPLAISFLAALLGVGGIAEKIKEIINKIRAPIFKLVTAVMVPLLRPLKKLYDKGAKFVKGVVDKGKALGKKALAKIKEKAGAAAGRVKGLFGKKGQPDERTMEQKQKAVQSAVDDAQQVMSEPKATLGAVKSKFPGLKSQYGLTSIELLPVGEGNYLVDAKINPEAKSKEANLGKAITRHPVVGVLGADGKVLTQHSPSGIQEDVVLEVRTHQLGQKNLGVEDLVGKRNYAMANITVTGKTASGKEGVFTLQITPDQLITIFSSGTGKVPKEIVKLGIVEAAPSGGVVRTLREPQIPPDVVALAPHLFISPGAQLVTAEEAELRKFIEALADAVDNRGYVPSLDKHSEQAAWQAFRANDAYIASRIESTSIVRITNVSINIHSEREMCPVCAAASNLMVNALSKYAPLTYEAIEKRRPLFETRTNVTSSGLFVGSARPAPEDQPTSTYASPPTGKTAPGPLSSARLKQLLENERGTGK